MVVWSRFHGRKQPAKGATPVDPTRFCRTPNWIPPGPDIDLKAAPPSEVLDEAGRSLAREGWRWVKSRGTLQLKSGEWTFQVWLQGSRYNRAGESVTVHTYGLVESATLRSVLVNSGSLVDYDLLDWSRSLAAIDGVRHGLVADLFDHFRCSWVDNLSDDELRSVFAEPAVRLLGIKGESQALTRYLRRVAHRWPDLPLALRQRVAEREGSPADLTPPSGAWERVADVLVELDLTHLVQEL